MKHTFPSLPSRVRALSRSFYLRMRYRKSLGNDGATWSSLPRLIWFILVTSLGIRPKSLLMHSEIPDKRIAICEACPIFDQKFRTCGSPQMPIQIENRIMGCLCPMDVAVHARFKNCWIYDYYRGEEPFGWPHELNGYPYA